MSQITTHILDTAIGRPVAGITIILFREKNKDWAEVARNITDADGRILGFLNNDAHVLPGRYKMRFETKDYYDKNQITTFYPFVEIIFDITSNEHYHIPLLLSPFGYSTYRGS